MHFGKLSTRFHVAPQITAEDLAEISADGFKTIISNRPDGEELDQPRSSDLATDAARHNITFLHVPVVAGSITDSDIEAFKRACEGIDSPILLFCRTGGRCRELWERSELD